MATIDITDVEIERLREMFPEEDMDDLVNIAVKKFIKYVKEHTIRVQEDGTIFLPRDVIDTLDLHPGDNVELLPLRKGSIELRKSSKIHGPEDSE